MTNYWADLAPCQGRQAEIYPDNGRPRDTVKRELCPSCPVREACLEWALESPYQPWGMWAGLDQSEVQRLWMSRHPGRRSTDAFAGVKELEDA